MKNKNPNKEIEERIKNITEILKQTPGIKSSYAMSMNETIKLEIGGKSKSDCFFKECNDKTFQN